MSQNVPDCPIRKRCCPVTIAESRRPTMRIQMRTPLTLVFLMPALVAGQDVPKPAAGEPPLPAGALKRLTDTRLRPGVRVTHLAFSPDGSRVASLGNWMYF